MRRKDKNAIYVFASVVFVIVLIIGWVVSASATPVKVHWTRAKCIQAGQTEYLDLVKTRQIYRVANRAGDVQLINEVAPLRHDLYHRSWVVGEAIDDGLYSRCEVVRPWLR